nr:hypothetical protein [Aeromicrobium sp.]
MSTAASSGQATVRSSGRSPGRRVRHDVADALLLAVFSLAASAAVALGLSAFSHWVAAS